MSLGATVASACPRPAVSCRYLISASSSSWSQFCGRSQRSCRSIDICSLYTSSEVLEAQGLRLALGDLPQGLTVRGLTLIAPPPKATCVESLAIDMMAMEVTRHRTTEVQPPGPLADQDTTKGQAAAPVGCSASSGLPSGCW